jgi:hypothetical protein
MKNQSPGDHAQQMFSILQLLTYRVGATGCL